MEQERNLGVTEARFALTLLTCLLVAIGYVALLRLAGAKQATTESGVDEVLPPVVVGTSDRNQTEPSPRVITIDRPDDTPIEHTTRRTRPPAPGKASLDSERR